MILSVLGWVWRPAAMGVVFSLLGWWQAGSRLSALEQDDLAIEEIPASIALSRQASQALLFCTVMLLLQIFWDLQ